MDYIFYYVVVLLCELEYSVNVGFNETFNSTFKDNETDLFSNDTAFNGTLDMDYDFIIIWTPPGQGGSFLFSDVEETRQFIQSDNQTQSFLSILENDFQRYVVQTQLEYCPFVPLCNFSLDVSSKDSCCEDCSCDIPDCFDRGDCCPDVITEEYTQPNTNRENCIPKYLRDTIGDGIIAVDKCPQDSDTELANNCTRLYTTDIKTFKEILPCTSNSTFEVYRNQYCAICNGEQLADLVFFNPQVHVYKSDNTFIYSEAVLIEMTLTDSGYEVEFEPLYEQENFTTSCEMTIDTCNVTGMWGFYDDNVRHACEAYKSMVKYNKVGFGNVFCALCNGVNITEVLCRNHLDPHYVYGFSGLLKMDVGFQDKEKLNGRCNETQFYDMVNDECKDLSCSEVHRLRNGQCNEKYEYVNSVAYVFYLRLIPQQPLDITTVNTNAAELAYAVTDMLLPPLSYYLCDQLIVFGVNNSVLLSNDMDILYTEIEFHLYLAKASKSVNYVVETLFEHLHDHQLNVSFDNETHVFQCFIVDSDPILYIMLKHFVSQVDVMGVCGADPANLTEVSFNHSTNLTKEIALLPHIQGCYQTPCYVVGQERIDTFYDVNKITSCPKVFTKTSNENIRWQNTLNGSLIADNGFRIDSSMFYFIHELYHYDLGIQLCLDAYQQYIKHNVPSASDVSLEGLTVVAIVSAVCSCLSVLALFTTFLTFWFLPTLRHSLPGKNNLMLTSVMLCSQVMFLVSSFAPLGSKSLSCQIVGCLVHCFWLLSMFWMNVCTYHMLRVLTQAKLASLSSGNRQFLKYHTYATTTTILFVSINIVYTEVQYSSFGYGKFTCYISYPEMILSTFALPTTLVIVSNIGMFLFVIWQISKAPSVSKNVKNERNDIIVFAKLSTITGFTWVFGIVNIWLEFVVFDYIFSVLNASQGVFIFLAFIVNARVSGKFKDRLSSFSSKRWSSRATMSHARLHEQVSSVSSKEISLSS